MQNHLNFVDVLAWYCLLLEALSSKFALAAILIPFRLHPRTRQLFNLDYENCNKRSMKVQL